MTIRFSGAVWYWKGPAPHYFVTVPEGESREIKEVASHVTYGWGMVPVTVRIGETEWKTAMFPKDGKYIVPLKAKARKAECVEEGDEVSLELEL